jgi:hypothetical protein
MGIPLPVQAKDEMARWATPTSRDYKDTPGMRERETSKHRSSGYLGLQAPRALLGGTSLSDGLTSPPLSQKRRLNPMFVEWLMGLPIGWTDFGPSGTPSSPPKQLSPSPNSPGGSNDNSA